MIFKFYCKGLFCIGSVWEGDSACVVRYCVDAIQTAIVEIEKAAVWSGRMFLRVFSIVCELPLWLLFFGGMGLLWCIGGGLI